MSYYMSHKQMKKLAVGIVTLLMAGGFQASVSADTSKAIVGGETTLTEDRVVNVLEPAAPKRPYAGIFNESKGDPTVLDMAGHNLTIQSFEKKGGKEEGVAGPIGILGMQGSKIEIYSNKNQPNTPKSTITIHEVAMYNDAVAQGGGQYGAIGIKMGDTYRDKASTANIDTDVVIEKLLGGTWHTRGIEAYGPVTLNIKGTFKVNPGAIGILKPKSGNVFTSAIFFSEDKGKINIHTVDIDDSQKNTLRRGIYAANGGGNTSVASMLHIGGGIFKVKEDAKGDYYLMDLGKGARVYFNTNEDGTAIGTQTADLQGTIRMNGASAYIGLTNNSKWKGGVTGNGSLNLFLAEGSEWDTTNGGMGNTISLLNGTGGVIRQKDSGKLTIKNYKGNAYLYYAHEGNGEETANYKAGDTYIEAAEANSTIKIFTDATNIGDATKALNAVVGKLYYTPKDKNLTAQAYIAEGLMTAPAKTLEQKVDWKDNGQGVINATTPPPVPGGEGHPSAEDTFTVDTSILALAGAESSVQKWLDKGFLHKDKYGDPGADYTIKQNTVVDLRRVGTTPEEEYDVSCIAAIYWRCDHGFVDMTGHSLTLNAAGTSSIERHDIYSENKLVMKNVKELILKGKNGSPKNYILIKGKNKGSVDISNGDQDALLKVENKDEQAKTLITIDANEADSGHATDNTFFKLKGTLESETKNATLAKIKNGSVSLDGVKFTTEGDGILSVYVDDGGIFNANSSFAGNVFKANEKKHDVIIEGNMFADGSAKGKSGKIGLALNTNNSYFTGLIGVKKGEAHMILKDGAVWNHESKGGKTNEIGNSSLNTFDGDKGFIYQKSDKKISIGLYKGNTTVFYEHKNQGTEAGDYTGGNIEIKKAVEGSSITVLTNNKNIDTSKDEVLNKVYNALAGKVYYDAYKNNEKNLKGKVGIAEGLLSTSKVLKLQDMTWKKENGQGEYKAATPPPAPKNEGPITKDETFTEDRTIKGTMNNARMVIGGGFGGDVYGGVAVFAKDNNVKVEMAGHNLDIQMSGFNNNHDIYGIFAKNRKKINITNETATGGKKGAITMSLDNSADDAGHVYGIYANKAKVSIDGDVTITKAVTTSGKYKKNFIAIMTKDRDSEIDLKGKFTMAGKSITGASDRISNERVAVKLTGARSKIHIHSADIDNKEGQLMTVLSANDEDSVLSIDEAKIYADKALLGEAYAGSTLNINTNKEGTEVADNTTDIQGDVQIIGMSKMNIGIKGEASKWVGTRTLSNRQSRGFEGKLNVYLADKGTWESTGDANSVVDKVVVTGDDGTIRRSGTGKLDIKSLSGKLRLIYTHKTNGETTADYVEGDTHINAAESGAEVTVLTNKDGINMDNAETLNKVYNALAGKVYYDAYATGGNRSVGENNLKGKVGIAEGLLSTSKVLKLQDMTWKKENGQGEYKAATPPPAPKNEGPITKDETFTEDRTIKGTMNNARMQINRLIGDVYCGVAVFAKDNHVNVEMAGHNLDIQMSGFNNNHDIYGIYAGNQKKINITNETATGGKKGAITMSLDNSANDAGNVYGIYASKTKVSIDGDVTITKAATNSSRNPREFMAIMTSDGDSEIDLKGKFTMSGKSIIGASDPYTACRIAVNLNGAKSKIHIHSADIDNQEGQLMTILSAHDGDSVLSIDEAKIYADKALLGEVYAGSTLNINMNKEGTAVAGNKTDIQGDVQIIGMSKMNIGIKGEGSKWVGTRTLANRQRGRFEGKLNVYLADKGTWESTGDRASVVDKVVATGEDGTIRRSGTGKLDIKSLSGKLRLIYTHKTNGETTADYVEGDTHINAAESGAEVTVLTNKDGINMDNAETLNKVYNALAGKVYYDAYATGGNRSVGENNLKGKVGIAEGLLSTSKVLKLQDMTWKKDNGQGEYKAATPSPDVPGQGGTITPDQVVEAMYQRWKKEQEAKGNHETTYDDFLKAFVGKQGKPGQSAFDIWKAQPGNASKTMDDFIDFIKGKTGEQGKPGQSAFDIWKAQPGNASKTMDDFIDFIKGKTGEQGKPGQSAFDIWKAQPGNASKTMDDFIDFIKGKTPGTSGQGTQDKYETSVMKGTRNSMLSAALLWRMHSNDLLRRMGDLRLTKEQSGVWAKYEGGQTGFDGKDNSGKDINISQKYKYIEVGYDTKVGDWTIGGAFEHGNSDDTYNGKAGELLDEKLIANGIGKVTTNGFAVYGTQIKETGEYIDIIARGGRIENKYEVHTENNELAKALSENKEMAKKVKAMDDSIKGTHKATGLSGSIEYGKRINKENGFYVEPSAELTISTIGASDADVTSEKGVKMHIHQDASTQAVGRIGISMGRESKAGHIFGKVALAHAFGGETKTVFSMNEGKFLKAVNLDLTGTWLDIELGGSYKMSDTSYIYGTFTKNFGAKLDSKWRLDAGIRFAF